MGFFGKNKPKAVFRNPRLPQISCCSEPSECCNDTTPGNDPTPPTNCGWMLSIADNTGDVLSVPVPSQSSVVLDGGIVEQGVDASITFTVNAISSPVGNITVLTSGAAGLDGSSTYVGATPVVPVGNSALAGTLTLDTSTPGSFSVTVTITTDCGPVQVTINYQVDTVVSSDCAWSLTALYEGGSQTLLYNPLSNTMSIDLGNIEQFVDAVIIFNATALASLSGNVTVFTSGASSLPGLSSYVGATPVIPVGNTALVGTFTADTATLGVFSASVFVETDCGLIEVLIDWTVTPAP